VLRGWQPKIDQRQRRRGIELGQQAFDLLARFGYEYFEVIRQDEVKCVGDERVVIDDKQGWF
jgi:hypothetical protein